MAEEADIPATLLAQMTANIAFDFLVHHLSSLNSFTIADFPPSIHRGIIPSTPSSPSYQS